MEPARKRGALAGSSEPAPIGPDDLVNEMVEYSFVNDPVENFKFVGPNPYILIFHYNVPEALARYSRG